MYVHIHTYMYEYQSIICIIMYIIVIDVVSSRVNIDSMFSKSEGTRSLSAAGQTTKQLNN